MEQTLSRRDRERQVRRQAMLEAAQAVFAEKGYANATLDEVAHRAEFGKGTLYNYFEGGKEEILFAIFDTLYDDFSRLIEQAFAHAEGRPFRTIFHDFVQACFTFFVERQDQFLLLVKEAQRMVFSEEHNKASYFQRQSERVVDVLVPPLEAAMARGELRPFPARGVAHTVFGNIKGYHMHICLQACHKDGTPPLELNPAQAADFITTMLLDGLLPRPDGTPPPPTS